MTKNYLFELGLEEIPARYLLSLSQQLEERVVAFLKEANLAFDHIQSFATPRRLAFRISGLAEQQADSTVAVKGPAMRIAKDSQGQWSKAALGFLKGQGASPEDVYVKSIKDEAYIFIDKFTPGQTADQVLGQLPTILKQLNFPVSMIWNTLETPFIRPVHWMVSLLDQEVVPFEFVGVKAGKESRGHRFLGHSVELDHADEYEERLYEQAVIVDFHKRQQVILDQIQQLAATHQWIVPIDEDLLEEVTSIVEWPTAFYGEFESDYLQVPEIVLITAMKDHQRYFYAQDKETKALLPIFISVRNGNQEHIDNVIKGNKKVLKARLEDALFFYQEDLKHDLGDFTAKLSQVKEHFKLGSLADKQVRVGQMIPVLASTLASQSPIHVEMQEAASRASQIYKFDLMTQVVGEFDELQGQMGQLYARHYGESDLVAQAIGNQYLPVTSGGALPQNQAGALLAFADKLDTLLQYFGIGMIPTGSNDPYALRRQAMGLVEISLHEGWDFDFIELLKSLQSVMSIEATTIWELDRFLKARMQQQLEKDQVDYDIIKAVLGAHGLNFKAIRNQAQALQSFKSTQANEYRLTIEALSRVVNLGHKHQEEIFNFDASQSESESQLMTWIHSLNHVSDDSLLDQFKQGVPFIEAYFENNMVNHDDYQIKANRLATMGQLSYRIMTLMDPREIITKF
ncbi:glycine--tRNA ligase subunit beta [Vaginisenegalia massiliensis]|uniref:glycine--tRNA ligase subunit beta n=1 Tax=Vaginisenegalia massiliensis TaxID=2058294 RepID=UPI000F53C9CF|nr:glycine--tRNA ligase subunit beta [Vaginisenegalia massiliensis]